MPNHFKTGLWFLDEDFYWQIVDWQTTWTIDGPLITWAGT